MFGKKSGKNKFRRVNAVFGEVSFMASAWCSRTPFVLWNKTYDILVTADSNLSMIEINEKQESAYTYLKDNMAVKRKEIEELLEDYYKTKDVAVLLSKFKPTKLFFGWDGECALCGEDVDDLYDEMTISILPQFGEIDSWEQYEQSLNHPRD